MCIVSRHMKDLKPMIILDCQGQCKHLVATYFVGQVLYSYVSTKLFLPLFFQFCAFMYIFLHPILLPKNFFTF